MLRYTARYEKHDDNFQMGYDRGRDEVIYMLKENQRELKRKVIKEYGENKEKGLFRGGSKVDRLEAALEKGDPYLFANYVEEFL